MNDTYPVRITWQGATTLASLATVIEKHGHADLELAPNLHHSLFVHLYPEALPGEPEEVDIHGDAELLMKVSEVGELTCLAELVPHFRAANVRIHVESPAPTLHIYVSDTARPDYR